MQKWSSLIKIMEAAVGRKQHSNWNNQAVNAASHSLRPLWFQDSAMLFRFLHI